MYPLTAMNNLYVPNFEAAPMSRSVIIMKRKKACSCMYCFNFLFLVCICPVLSRHSSHQVTHP
jgi:hypothetical protein